MADFNLSNLNPFYVNKNINKVPRKRVLTSNAEILLITQNFGLPNSPGNDIEIPLGEIDNFAPTSQYEVIKQSKPFGFNQTLTQQEFKGYNITFSGGKVDWALSYLMYCQEKILSGETVSNSKEPDDTFHNLQVIMQSPLFAIRYSITHYNKIVESYIFKDVIFTNFSFEMTEDASTIPETISAFSPQRIIDPVFLETTRQSKINSKVNSTLELMKKINKV